MKLVAARSRTGVVFHRQPDGSFARAATARAVKSFDAANFNRLTSDWNVSRLSADAELQGKLEILRARARDHEQNEPYAEAYLKLRENNVVGHDGFTLQMKVRLSETQDAQTGEMVVVPDKAANRAIERGWTRFCARRNFLVTRDMHAVEACKLIERTYQRDGDFLIRKVKGAPNEFGFALQLLEADYLDDRYIDFRGVACNCPEERTLPNGQPFPFCERGLHEVRMGVELHGDWKFPVAYWLLANHPGDYFFGNQYATRRIRVPVEEIIHPFVHKRIEQTRGLPATVAAMLRLQMIGGMDEAALVAARAGAQKMGIITKEIPDEFVSDESSAFDPDALAGRTIEGAPGEFLELPMGYDIKSIDWKNPDDAYAPFQKLQLRGAAAGMGVSYSSLANDPSDANFSATRIGMLEEREGYRGGHRFFINHILREIFPDFLEAAMLTGQVDLPFSRFEDFTDEEAVCFHGRGFPWVDPTKDIAAAKEAIELGIDTRSRIAAENAGDFEEITAELQREDELRHAAGLGESVEGTAPSVPGNGEEDTPKPKPAIKSASLGDITLGELPAEVEANVRQFVPGVHEKSIVARYGMTVPELLSKADQQNLETARHHLRNAGVRESKVGVLERKDKFVLLMNDRIIDGHHHLAKAEKGKVTSSLPVLDLTPLRYQSAPADEPLDAQKEAAVKALIATGIKGWVTINGGHVFIDDAGNFHGGTGAHLAAAGLKKKPIEPVAAPAADPKPARKFDDTLLHGVDFQPGQDLAGHHAIEKFDGHRVRWDGKQLRTRKGAALDAPAHFTAGLGPVPFDAELYAGPGQRDRVSAAMKRGGDWQGLTLQAFDLPGHPGDYAARHASLATLILPAQVERPPMRTVANTADAIAQMHEVTARGGEGLILHAPGRKYAQGRVKGVVKLKPEHLPTTAEKPSTSGPEGGNLLPTNGDPSNPHGEAASHAERAAGTPGAPARSDAGGSPRPGGRSGALAEIADQLAGVERAADGDKLSAGRQFLAAFREQHPELHTARNLARQFAAGGEHHVELAESGSEVLKHTRDGLFGTILDHDGDGHIVHRAAAASEYLARMAAQNQIFHSDLKFVGLHSDAGGGFTYSQTFVAGQHPTDAGAVHQFMEDAGFHKVSSDAIYSTTAEHTTWYHPDLHLASDAKLANFIQMPEGKILPIDLIVQRVRPGSPLHQIVTRNLE